MSISFSGLASGIDTSSWVQSLTALKRAKIATLEEEKSALNLSFETLNNIKMFFTSFRACLEKITDAKFNDKTTDVFSQKLVTSSRPEKVNASVSSTAKEGKYDVKVMQLATSTEAKSGTKVNQTYDVEVLANKNTKLKELGVLTGDISLKNGTNYTITNDTTIQDFVNVVKQDNNISKYLEKFDFDEATGRFEYVFNNPTLTMDNVINDIGGTQLISQLGLDSVVTNASDLRGGTAGYTSNLLDYEVTTYTTTTVVTTSTQTITSTQTHTVTMTVTNTVPTTSTHTVSTTFTNTIETTTTQTITTTATNTIETTTTQTVLATDTTLLSELGVNSGVLSIYSYESGAQSVTISSDDTISSLVSKIPGASFSNGVLNLNGVEVYDDGTTSLISALGLTTNVDDTPKVSISDALFYTSSGVSGTNAGFLEQITIRDTSTMTALSSVSESTTISSGTYKISTTEELAQLATMANSGKITGGEFVLADNIDLSSISNWTPIGKDSSNGFKGTFDGNGYTISNLTINSSDYYVGLFGYSQGVIKNVALENVDITATGDFAKVGGLVGSSSSSSSSITNCNVSGNITATGSYAYVGGLVGDSSSDITNCNVSANITATGSSANVGGLVGDSYATSITNCNVYSTMKVDTTNIGSSSGGAIGYASSSVNLTNVNIYCSNDSNIKAHFVGMTRYNYSSDVKITNSYYNRNLSGKDYGYDCTNEAYTSVIQIGSSAALPPSGLMQSVTRRDTSSMTALSSVSESTEISSGTYKISTTEELAQLATMANSGKIKGGEFVLADNIDLSSISNWTPIGKDYSNSFKGTFDGNGYTISNITINSNNADYVGLFGYSYGDIKNVALENVDITATNHYAYVGGLVGSSTSSDITNCNVSGKITAYGSSAYVGGLVGFFHAFSDSITNCNVSGNITATGSYGDVGGLAGYSSSSSITNCNVYSSFDVSSGNSHTAGAVGYSADSLSLDNVNIYASSLGNLYAVFVGLKEDYEDLSISNSNFYSSTLSSGSFLSYRQVIYGYNSSGATAVDPSTATPPIYYQPIGGNNSILNAWDDQASVKLVNLTDADGNSLGITTGTVSKRVNNSVQTFTITDETTLQDFMSFLGDIAQQDTDGGLKITLSGIACLEDGSSNITQQLFSVDKLSGADFYTSSNEISTTNTVNSSRTETVTVTSTNTIHGSRTETVTATSTVTIVGTQTETVTTTLTVTIPISLTNTTTVSTTNTIANTSTLSVSGSTRLSDLSNEPLPKSWVLNLKDKDGNDVSRTINIRSTETFNSLIEKLNSIDGITAYLENGNKFTIVTDPSKYSDVYLEGEMYDYLSMSKLSLGGSSGLQITSKDLKYNETHTTTLRLSASNYVNDSVKLSDLNISSGSFALFNNGVRAVITVDEKETLSQLRNHISSAFSDLRLEINDGKVSIYSTENTEVNIGSNIDSSNITSIMNFERDEATHGLVSSSSKYMVNENSVVTKSGLFRAGTVTAGNFRIGDQEINIDDQTTISDIISQINHSETSQAQAYWDSINGELVITSRVNGAFYIDIEEGTSNFSNILGYTEVSEGKKKLNIDSQTMGKNSIFSINGTRMVSSSNTIQSDISRIDGLTLNLKDITEGESVTISIEKDKETPANAISDIVDSYNELIENVDKELARDGNLNGQSVLKMIRNRIRSLMTGSIATSSQYKNLSTIGIKTDSARSGNISTSNISKLYFDREKFEIVFQGDSEGIKALLVGTEAEPGVLTQLENLVEDSLKSVSGYFDSASNSYTKKIKQYDDKIDKLNMAADRYKANLEKKFQLMDMVISKMQNSYSSFLST